MDETDKFPRDKQNALLIRLYNTFPRILTEEEFYEIVNMFGSEETFAVNAWYLHAQGLIGKAIHQGIDGTMSCDIGGLKITRDGIDFIRDDGGLSAVLNVSTIKIHDSTIEKLTEAINKSSLSGEEKKTFISQLKSLPAEAVKHLTLELLSKALTSAPELIHGIFH